ncbi:MAG: radical SAM protein [Verrucomicrobiae bacterium]|nr:radical SAM protein [Verrucomicrobiae bacterium]
MTERCNLRCAHCYQGSYDSPELTFDQWLEVLAQLDAWLAQCQAANGRRPRLHLNLTGGEPFIHPDFLRLLEVLAARRDRLSFAILCNGHFIDDAMARRLAPLRPDFVQVSIEGLESTHDGIRGKGSFARTTSAIRHLRRAHIPVLVSFTAHQANYREFPAVARLACRLRVTRLWADRLIPSGNDPESAPQPLSSAETREFLELMRAARDAASQRWFKRTQVTLHRALQFLTGHGLPYRCTAGESLLALLPNGDLLPCRRLPIRIGNILATPLAQLYAHHPTLRALREPDVSTKGCEGCSFHRLCRGGLRCLSHAIHGDPLTSDPGCWLAAGTGRSPEESADGRTGESGDNPRKRTCVTHPAV